jgi:hypothetical protein
MSRIALALSLVVFTGCADQDGEDPSILPVFGDELQGRLSGQLPEVGDFAADTAYGYGSATDDFLDVSLNADGDFGWAMIGLYAPRDADGQVVLDDGMVIGCSGPGTGQALFDEPAEDAQVVVESVVVDGQDFVSVEVLATFGGGQEVEGRALVPVGGGW